MATWTKQNVNTASWTKSVKNLINQFLLLESGGYILQENGFKLILEQSVPSINWTKLVKS